MLYWSSAGEYEVHTGRIDTGQIWIFIKHRKINILKQLVKKQKAYCIFMCSLWLPSESVQIQHSMSAFNVIIAPSIWMINNETSHRVRATIHFLPLISLKSAAPYKDFYPVCNCIEAFAKMSQRVVLFLKISNFLTWSFVVLWKEETLTQLLFSFCISLPNRGHKHGKCFFFLKISSFWVSILMEQTSQ